MGLGIKLIDGFFTNTWRFVDRKEAADIAYKAKQTLWRRKVLSTDDLGEACFYCEEFGWSLK